MGIETFLDPGDRKFIIGDQLEKEINKVKIIKENVEKSNQITKGIVDILNSFEHRLAKLEETILPVYNETGNLQRQQQNIEKVMSLMDHVIGYYSVAEDVADTIKAGPSIKGLDEYLASLNKLKGAQSYFEKNNPQSVELENVSSLYSKGVDTLLREFHELLVKHSRPMAPITLLDLIATDEDVSEDGSVGSVGTLLGGENIAAELATIAAWLLSEGRLELLKTYATVRASVMLRSINNLKDHHKSNSKGSTHNMVSPSLSVRLPKYQNKSEGSGRKRLQAVLEKKANKMLLKASQTIENSTGLSIGGRRSNLYLEKELAVEESEMESYLVCVMGVQRLMTTERNLMSNIIPSSHHNPVYQNIIQDSLSVIVADGENIADRAKKCISRKDFGSVLVIFPILKNLLSMRPDFDRAVEGCDYNIRSQFTNILNILHATAGKALEEIVESLRGDGTGLPKDGTVHELTSNTLVTIAQLTEFSQTISQVLARDPAYQGHQLRTNADQTSALLSLYIRRVLSELNCTLTSKSEVYPDAGVKALFRLNNAHHVLKALQRSNLLDLVAISEPDCEATYLAIMNSQKQAYQTSWNKLVTYITLTDDIVTAPGKMRDKDRNAIKERFIGFNKEMEEIVKLQRSYSVPDVELRQSLKRDNKEYILPLYNKFYNTFSSVPFTKNIDKYIKYSPDQVASMIDRFFDVAA